MSTRNYYKKYGINNTDNTASLFSTSNNLTASTIGSLRNVDDDIKTQQKILVHDLYETRDMGKCIGEELDNNSKQLENIDNKLREIDHKLDVSNYLVRRIDSMFSYFRKPKTEFIENFEKCQPVETNFKHQEIINSLNTENSNTSQNDMTLNILQNKSDELTEDDFFDITTALVSELHNQASTINKIIHDQQDLSDNIDVKLENAANKLSKNLTIIKRN
jgi:hypothetical protein